MSFVTNLLISAGAQEKVDLEEKIAEIQKEITKLKCNVKDFMEDTYAEFVVKLKSDKNLFEKADKLLKEMEVLQSRVDNHVKIGLSGSAKELKSLANNLNESNLSLQLCDQLLDLHNCIKSIESYQQKNKLVESAKLLERMDQHLRNKSNELEGLEVYRSIIDRYRTLNDEFVYSIGAAWEQCLKWKSSEDQGSNSNKGAPMHSLTIDFESTDIDIGTLKDGLYYANYLSNFIHDHSKRLIEHFVVPIICHDCTVKVDNEQTFSVKLVSKRNKPGYQRVLYNLTLLLRFLNQHLSIELKNGQTIFHKVAEHLIEPLSKTLLQHCISPTIPTSVKELNNYQTTLNEFLEFQEFLFEIGFIESQEQFLPEFTSNLDGLFKDKMCQGLLTRAREIIKKDLHDSVKCEFKEVKSDVDNQILVEQLDKYTFSFPTCQISKSTEELMKLAKEVLDEACTADDDCAVKLFYTCRNIFEMYAGLVPEHHKQFIETIPQQVALFHNNCMYLAHKLVMLGFEYANRLPGVLQIHNITFADQIKVLRKIGAQHFLRHMTYQKNIIIEILRESELSALGQITHLPSSSERVIRQCIRQLELLKTVWIDVLPTNVYCKSMGCLLDSMIDDLVIKVISVEDIPAKVASELVNLYNIVVNRAPSIFPEDVVIQQYVKKWVKFTYLIKILGASLKEIENLWGSGKGPLPYEFTASQIKQLIRALFQNTDRRSALLASIK